MEVATLQPLSGVAVEAGRETSDLTGSAFAPPAARPQLSPDNRFYRPFPRQEIARGYSAAYFLLGELVRTQAHLIGTEGWQILVEACSYVGWRYNKTVLINTGFEPKPWKGSVL